MSQSILRLCGVKNNKYMTLMALLFHGLNLAILSGKRVLFCKLLRIIMEISALDSM
jgi:hypothetical protein